MESMQKSLYLLFLAFILMIILVVHPQSIHLLHITISDISQSYDTSPIAVVDLVY